MKRIVRANLTLAALSLIGSAIQAAQADVRLTDHQAFYAIDFAGAQAQYRPSDRVNAAPPGDSPSLPISLLGDPSPFAWEGWGASRGTDVPVPDVTAGPGSASATLTVTGSATLT